MAKEGTTEPDAEIDEGTDVLTNGGADAAAASDEVRLKQELADAQAQVKRYERELKWWRRGGKFGLRGATVLALGPSLAVAVSSWIGAVYAGTPPSQDDTAKLVAAAIRRAARIAFFGSAVALITMGALLWQNRIIAESNLILQAQFESQAEAAQIAAEAARNEAEAARNEAEAQYLGTIYDLCDECREGSGDAPPRASARARSDAIRRYAESVRERNARLGTEVPMDLAYIPAGGPLALGRVNLAGASMVLSNLAGANLFHANLSSTMLTRANLNGARLIGANFKDARLVNANLIDADLIDADLTGANLTGANLSGANLTGATLDLCCYNERTVWPFGFRPDIAAECSAR